MLNHTPAESHDACGRSADAIDAHFSVPQVHRLRFTEDLFGADRGVLFDVIRDEEGSPPKVLFCCDENLASARPDLERRVRELAEVGDFQPTGTHRVPGGEASKNDPAVVDKLLDRIHAAGLDRRSYLVAAGGGAALDAIGYAAAIAHRGVRLVRLPSTTLGQSDSGVGVKNAVNRFGKKNWQGCFATPWAVINDRGLLTTLSDRDFRAGFSEAVKVALLKSGSFFERIRSGAESIRRRNPTLCSAVLRDAALAHLRHITEGGDAFESEAARPLDFGHWSAHRLESLSGYELRHGEAVSIGLAIDVVYSASALGLPASSRDAVLETLTALDLPIAHPLLREPAALMTGLEEFRQHLGGRLTVTMLTAIGEPIELHEIDERAVRDALAFVLSAARNGSSRA